MEQDFAFLRCYENAAGALGDKLAEAGCVRIKPDARHNRAWYEVVPFASLLSREYIVAKYDEPGIYHVSSFVSN